MDRRLFSLQDECCVNKSGLEEILSAVKVSFFVRVALCMKGESGAVPFGLLQ